MLSSHTVEKQDNNNTVINMLKLTYTQKNSNVFAYMLQLIYNIHIYTAKTRLSFYAYTDRRDAVNQSIFRFIRSIYMHRNHIYNEDMTQSLLIYTKWQQRLCACVATYIHHTHIHIAKIWLNFCTFTRSCDAVNCLIFRFIRSICTHRNHIHCKDMTQSLLIYTKWQQRLCAHAAIHIRYTHIHCEDTTQLLHIYTSVWRSKLIRFDFLINLHAL